MKEHNIKNFILTMVLCISAALSGCAASAKAPKEPTKSTATDLAPSKQVDKSEETLFSCSASSAEAYERGELPSSEDQAKAEKARRAEIAEKYSMYEPYGMTYDKERDRFFYNGQIVRFFNDQANSENTLSFSYDEGVIDVEPIRNTGGTLTGLKQSSDADFKARTQKQEKIKAELKKASIAGESESYEVGDPNYRDDSLDAYTAFGVSYDEVSENWMYDGKAIHILYDSDYNTYCANDIDNGVNLKVVRDKKGNIEKLVKTDERELEQCHVHYLPVK